MLFIGTPSGNMICSRPNLQQGDSTGEAGIEAKVFGAFTDVDYLYGELYPDKKKKFM